MYKSILAFLFAAFPVFAFTQIGQIRPAADTTSSPLSVSASAYYYFVQGSSNNSVTLIGYLDYKSLHIEPRYNYEAENAGSVFAGWKFEAEGKVSFAATPMAGIVFGSMKGFAPGLELEFSYKVFDFYSESEYVIDQAGSEFNFFYTWTELGYSPLEKFRTGISIQRTLLYQTALDLQRGVFAEYSFWKLTAGLHYFNPFSKDYFFMASLNFEL
ncbi:MAG TPA: hypothetical protein VFE04_01255 [Puia sp.]|nr:hypothetical protein [Puia sp.]